MQVRAKVQKQRSFMNNLFFSVKGLINSWFKISLLNFADKKDKLQLVFGVICGIITSVLFPFTMIFTGEFINIFSETNRNSSMANGFNVSLKIIIAGIALLLSGFIGLYSWNLAAVRQSNRYKKLYYKVLLEQQVAWFDSNDPTKLSTQVTTNISNFQNAIGHKSFLLITTLTLIFFGFIYSFIKCWQLSLVLSILLPFTILSGGMMIKVFADIAKLSKTSYEDAAGRAEQAFGTIKTIKSLVGEDFQVREFVKCLNNGREKIKRAMVIAAVCFSFVSIFYINYALGFWYGKELIIHNGYTPKDIISTFYTFMIGGMFLGQISPILKYFVEGNAAVQHLNKLLNRKKTLVEKQVSGHIIKTIQSLELKNVSFAYKKVHQRNMIQQKSDDAQNLVLHNVNIGILKNKVNAIVGESGCGKSTIFQLLMRYYDPTDGEVQVNGTNLFQINIQQWRNKIGYVGQEPVLFSMTIQENIQLANPTITQQQVINVLKRANAWEFVSKLQNGIKTYVGTNGAQLSGGQKQRIAIARAIAKNPQLLIFDEATSALDRKNEKEIQETLKNLSKSSITTIVIAHRLSTIQDADKIFVLNKGRVVEQGLHKELLKQKSLYFTLVKNQLTEDTINQNEQTNSIEFQTKNPLKDIQENMIKKNSQQNLPPKQTQTKNSKSSNIYKKLFKFSSKYNYILFIGVFFSVLSGIIPPLFYFFLGSTFSLLNDSIKNSQEINFHCLMQLIVAIIGSIFAFLYKYSFDLYGEKIVYELRKEVFNKLIRLPVSFYDKKQNTPGALSAKLSVDANQLGNVISGICAAIFINISTVGISILISLYYSWQLTLVLLILSPMMVFYGKINSAVLKHVSAKTQQVEKYIGSLVSDTVQNIRTVKSVGSSDIFLNKYQEKINQFNIFINEKIIKSSFFDGMGRSISFFCQGIAYMAAGIMYQNHLVSSAQGIYITIFTLITAAGAIGKNSALMPDMVKAKIAGDNLFNILEQKDQNQLPKEKGLGSQLCTQSMMNEKISFKNVTFKYPERQDYVFNNLSFSIEKGMKAAFVGISGSGKSTIAQILQRFYPLQSGIVQINGKNIEQFQLYSYRKLIGYVSQQPILFKGTIKQNIKYDRNFSNEEVDRYLQIADAKKFLEDWNEKQQKIVGNKGLQISGGQKQRLAIARCIIRNPSLYIFDESTSALDADIQRIVSQGLKPLLKNKTSIVIAHRLSTIQDCDKIMVISEGKVEEEGSYHELIEKRGYFYNLQKGK